MRKLVVLLCPALLLASTFLYAQPEDSLQAKTPLELTIDLGVVQQQILSHHFVGINYAIKGYLMRRLVMGAYISYSVKKIPDTFHYTIGQPTVQYGEVGWITGYDVVQTPHWRVDVNLLNGVAYTRLGDNDQKELHRGSHGRYYESKRIAANTYYLLEPGVDVSYRIAFFHHGPDIYLTAKSSYRALVGGSRFGNTNDFSGSLFGIGLSLIGYDKDEKKSAQAEKITAML